MKKFSAPMQFLAAVVVLALIASACNKPPANTKPDDVDYYTCTMHPSVRSQDPDGHCPICSMNLVPVMKKKAAAEMDGMAGMPGMTNDDMPSDFSIPETRLQQIGVTYATIGKQPFRHTIRAVGTVDFDHKRQWRYVARVDGYVKELFVFSRGELVEKNAPLLTIYSPDLLTTQREFVDLLKSRDAAGDKKDQVVLQSTESLIQGARQRMRLWNITDEQIAALEKSRKPEETLTLYSPFRGAVESIDVDQGRKVMTGDRLADIIDLSSVWVWAQFYQDELPMIHTGLGVVITSSSYPDEKFPGKISLVDPFMNEATRTGRMRIDVDNPGLKLRPDMYVNVDLSMDMGESVAVPVGAVLPTGKHNIVFVSKGGGHLEPRFVELGRQYADYYEVKNGLQEGEKVVTSANFLIDAEAKVQGALKSW